MNIDDLVLSAETDIDAETRQRREQLVRQLAVLPDEAFTRLQYLQVQIGCANRCAFCSQQAGTDVWQLSASGLAISQRRSRVSCDGGACGWPLSGCPTGRGCCSRIWITTSAAIRTWEGWPATALMTLG
jgi:bacterioferritin-associated ferredoxin